jgi:hypothetical protein
MLPNSLNQLAKWFVCMKLTSGPHTLHLVQCSKFFDGVEILQLVLIIK